MIYGDHLQIAAIVKQSDKSGMSCIVTTISDTIIKFTCESQLNPELGITLKMDGMSLISANLLWKKRYEYGCQIDYTFHPAVIKSMMERLDRRQIERVA